MGSRLQRFRDNVQQNYSGISIEYGESPRYVSVRIDKDEDFEQNLRRLAGLIGGHKLHTRKVGDGTYWAEYWVETVSHSLSNTTIHGLNEDRPSIWRKPL